MRTVSLIFLTLTMSYRPVLCASAFYVGDRLEDDYNMGETKSPSAGERDFPIPRWGFLVKRCRNLTTLLLMINYRICYTQE